MGRHYTESMNKHREEFSLNPLRYEEIKRDIIFNKIEQRVRYKEITTKVVHNQEIY
jgi:hypothetical protein